MDAVCVFLWFRYFLADRIWQAQSTSHVCETVKHFPTHLSTVLPGNHRGFSRPEWFISLTPLSACAFGENNQGSALLQIAHGV